MSVLMSVLTDTELVLRWLVWDVRRGDLPSGIAEAIDRLTPSFPRREAPPRSVPYAKGRFHMVVFPDNKESTPMIDSYPLDPGAALNEALAADPLYVLICDDRFEAEGKDY